MESLMPNILLLFYQTSNILTNFPSLIQTPINSSQRWTVSELFEYNSPDKKFNCQSKGFVCPQPPNRMIPKDAIQSEDCLNLNIWIPSDIVTESGEIDSSANLPVMIFIHGGAFVVGSGVDNYIKGNNFNENGVILVSLNYRVGAFGFPAFSGILQKYPFGENLGLLDQRLAVSWVFQNIRYFGGNPEQVTLFGESAGAVSLTWHLAADESKVPENLKIMDKIQGVIIQSSPNLHYVTCDEHRELQESVLSYFGCSDYTGEEYIQCLREKDTQSLVDYLPGLVTFRKIFWHTLTDKKYAFMPCVSSSEEAVFHVEPRDYFVQDKKKSDVKIMVGTTKDESSLFIWLAFLFHSQIEHDTFEKFISAAFEEDHAKQILERYLPSHLRVPGISTKDNLSELANDLYFQCGAEFYANELSRTHDVYRYVFTHVPSSGRTDLGAFHSLELPYIFNYAAGGLFPESFNETDRQLVSDIATYWFNFAKYGDPVPKEQESRHVVDWPLYEASEQISQVLRVPVEHEKFYKQDVCTFWKSIYPTGILYAGEGDELDHENWDTFLINEIGYSVIRNFKRVVYGILGICILLLFITYRCCCANRKAKTMKPKRE